METAIGIVVGAIVAIIITITVETLRRPKLRMRLAPAQEVQYSLGSPASAGKYLHADLVNEPLPWLFRWLSRDPALQCRGTVTFHNLDGGRYFAASMPIRFSRSPQPVPLQIAGNNGFTAVLIDPDRMSLESRVDVHAGESTPFDIAVKFDSDVDCYGWSNQNYFCDPQWRHPDWKLPPGRYLVGATIQSSGVKCSGVFRLLNQGSTNDFRLEKAQPNDKITDQT
jgi:hypothetical protein